MKAKEKVDREVTNSIKNRLMNEFSVIQNTAYKNPSKKLYLTDQFRWPRK